MKVYNVCVKRQLRVYKFTITAPNPTHALAQLKEYINLTNRDYKLQYIMEAR